MTACSDRPDPVTYRPISILRTPHTDPKATPVTLTCQGQTVPVTSPEKGVIAFETQKGREYRMLAAE